MKDDEGETILRFEATDSAQAIQGAWTVTSYYDGGTAMIRARWRHDGPPSSRTAPSAAAPGATATTAPTRSTARTSPSARSHRPLPPAGPRLDTQQNNFLAALELARTFEVAGDRLDLFREDAGTRQLHLRLSPAALGGRGLLPGVPVGHVCDGAAPGFAQRPVG